MSIAQSFLSPSTDGAHAGHAAFVLRVALGVVLIAHGLLKVLVFGLEGSSAFFTSQGFAAWLVYPVIALETVGGLLLLLGLWVRAVSGLSAILLAVTVAVHAPNGWLFSAPNGGWEYPVFLTLAAIAVALGGAGRYAVRWPAAQEPNQQQAKATAAA